MVPNSARTGGNAMQNAVPVGQGAMAALLGLEYDVALEVAREAAQGEVCDAANDNGGAQVVVSGHKSAVERAVAIAQTKGAKRAVREILPLIDLTTDDAGAPDISPMLPVLRPSPAARAIAAELR